MRAGGGDVSPRVTLRRKGFHPTRVDPFVGTQGELDPRSGGSPSVLRLGAFDPCFRACRDGIAPRESGNDPRLGRDLHSPGEGRKAAGDFRTRESRFEEHCARVPAAPADGRYI